MLKENGFLKVVERDPKDENHFYEFGENGRLVSDYDISELDIIDDLELRCDIGTCDSPYRWDDTSIEICKQSESTQSTYAKVLRSKYNVLVLFTENESLILEEEFPDMDISIFDDIKYGDKPVDVTITITRND